MPPKRKDVYSEVEEEVYHMVETLFSTFEKNLDHFLPLREVRDLVASYWDFEDDLFRRMFNIGPFGYARASSLVDLLWTFNAHTRVYAEYLHQLRRNYWQTRYPSSWNDEYDKTCLWNVLRIEAAYECNRPSCRYSLLTVGRCHCGRPLR